MIRVLHVVTYMGRGGLETMIMNYYRQVDRNQVQFDFLVHRDCRADYDDEIESLGGRIFRLPRLVPWSRSYNSALDAFFDQHPEYRIVHVHQDCLSSVILKSAKKHGVPVRIAHSHNSSQDKNVKYLIKLYYKRQIPNYATHLFACSEKAGEWMFGNNSFSVLSNAIDTKLYAYDVHSREFIRNELGIPGDALVVGHIGRFMPQKNHGYLIDIFKSVHDRNDSSVLLLVGDGDDRKTIEKKVQTLGLANSVIFAGVRSDIPALLSAMDVFVFPSKYEGLPVTLVEAQASGISCFISDGISDESIITDRVEVIPLESGSGFWAEKIMAKSGSSRVTTEAQVAAAGFDIAENAEKLQRFYLENWKE